MLDNIQAVGSYVLTRGTTEDRELCRAATKTNCNTSKKLRYPSRRFMLYR